MNKFESIVLNVNDTFSKFFGYSSIQAKIIASILAILLIFLLRKIVIKILIFQFEDMKLRYRFQKATSYTTFVFAFLIIGQIWFEGIQSIVTYLGLVSAGIAIALKDPITNIAGWLFILWRSPLEVDDRIQLGEFSGDVIDINLFNFTIMEIGNWVDSDDNTGRIVHIPNGKIFTEMLANYGKGFKYIFNEIPVLLTFESDWKKAKMILTDIIENFASDLSKKAEKRLKEASKKFLIHHPKLDPEVYTNVKDSGVNLTIRYLCIPRDRRQSEQEIWEQILNKFVAHDNIEFAYPTMRRYNARLEGDTKKVNNDPNPDNQ